MNTIKVALAYLAAVIALVSLPASIFYASGVRADQQNVSCRSDQKQYDTLHALIQKVGEPTTQASSFDVVIPALGSTPQRVVILPPAEGAPPPDLSPYFAILGARPRC